jgi:hypothetical protein
MNARPKDWHPAYTVEPGLACDAADWGGNHTCSCVYRKTICNGLDHLCMCGSTWRTTTGAYSRCRCNHERNTDMPIPVGVEITAHQGEFRLTVSMEAEVSATAGSVQREQLRRATRAMKALLTTTADDDDDDDEY